MVKWRQLLKRPFCIALCSAVVITSGNFTVPGMADTVKAAEEAGDLGQEMLITKMENVDSALLFGGGVMVTTINSVLWMILIILRAGM